MIVSPIVIVCFVVSTSFVVGIVGEVVSGVVGIVGSSVVDCVVDSVVDSVVEISCVVLSVDRVGESSSSVVGTVSVVTVFSDSGVFA